MTQRIVVREVLIWAVALGLFILIMKYVTSFPLQVVLVGLISFIAGPVSYYLSLRRNK